MPLFPFFVDLTGQRGLIIGGNAHAADKLARMLPYGAALTVIAHNPIEEMEALAKESGTPLLRRAFDVRDLEPAPMFVITSLDDPQENERIFKLCRERRILVNAVDQQPACTFIFPSLIARGDLSVGISTNGASPATAMQLKKKIDGMLPEDTADILAWLRAQRGIIAEAMPDKRRRFALHHALARRCMEEGRTLSESELSAMIEEMAEENR